MKVLWFTNSPSCYNTNKEGYNGGGWITSLREEIAKNSNIELAIAFHLDNKPFKDKVSNITYYPIHTPDFNNYQKNLTWLFKGEKKLTEILENKYLDSYLKVINDYKPDLIHIFGSERYFSILSDKTNIPIVLHIQGFMNPIFNAYFPCGISEHDYIWLDYNPLKIINRKRNLLNIKNSVKRELRTLKNIKYFMGRTTWDYRLSKIYNPNSIYFHCDEILRPDFYQLNTHQTIKTKIVSTISSPLYKGEDLIIKTAKILNEKLNSNFEWHIFGVNKPSNNSKITKIKTNNNIIYRGIVDSQTLKQELQECAIYVHPSYIDNSPNSLCEAQIMGIPTIATFVGGIPSLIENEKTGYLVPANDPFQTAFIINKLLLDDKLRIEIGKRAKETALLRHDKSKITSQVLKIYENIIL